MKLSKPTLLSLEEALKISLILFWLWWFQPMVKEFANFVPRSARTDELMFIGLLLAGAVAGTFQFTYKKSDMAGAWIRLLGHATSGSLMFGIGLLMEIAYYVMKHTYGLVEGPLETAIVVVFASIILYDYWDILHSCTDTN